MSVKRNSNGSVRMKVVRGDEFRVTMTAYTDVDATVPRDLTSVTIRSAMRKVGSDVYVEHGVTITDAPNGVFDVWAKGATTQAWLPGIWLGDVEYTEAGVVNSTNIITYEVTQDVVGSRGTSDPGDGDGNTPPGDADP